MTAPQDQPGKPEPLERFHATSGRFVGTMTLVVVMVLLVYLGVEVHTRAGLELGTGLLFFGVLVWLTQLRPRAFAYPDTLYLQNSLRDAIVPLAAIDEVSVRRMLSVWVGDKRYVCTSIGKPLRTMVKGKRRGPSSMLGWDRLEAYTEQATPPRPDQTAMSYGDFVETRIVALVEDARRADQDAGTAARDPREVWVWPNVAALAVTAVLFALSFLV